jgi:hypothetical protein
MGVDILVRAAWDRAIAGEEQYLWKAMATAPLAATVVVKIPPRKALPARKDSPQRAEQPAREAIVEVRYRALTLKPPRGRRGERLPRLTVHVVWAVETLSAEHRAAGIEPVEWMLLSTLEVKSGKDALQRLEWYACRWSIEVWHKVLKSGCRIEQKQLETAERIKRCLSVYSVIAWRILFGVMLARAVPEIPCTILLEQDEWKALYCKIHRRPELPHEPPTLRTAVRWIASLGGFLGRKGDGEPGAMTLWRGFQHLVDLTAMYQIMSKRSPLTSG